MAWDPNTDKHCTCTYVGWLVEVGKTATLNKKFNMKIEPGFYCDIRVLASDFQDYAPGHVHRLFFNRGPFDVKQYKVMKYDERNLPLYINWFWNEWILTQLKEMPQCEI